MQSPRCSTTAFPPTRLLPRRRPALRFTNPLGIEIGRTGELPPIPEDADPRDWLEQELGDLEIDSETGVTRWPGERIDWRLAVGHLFD